MSPIPAREHLPALALVAVALLLLAGSAWFVYADFRPDYRLAASPAEDVPPDADVLDAADLPPEARSAFEAARGGSHVVHEDPAYHETFPLYDAVYVRDGGTVYRVWASSDGLNGLSLFLAVPAAALALALAAVGVRSYRRGEVRTPLAALSGIAVAVLAGVVTSLPFPLYLGEVGLLPVVAGVVAAALAWVGLGREEAA